MKLGLALANDRFIILSPAESKMLMDIIKECHTVYSRVGEGDHATFFTTTDRPTVLVIREEQIMTVGEEQYKAMKKPLAGPMLPRLREQP